MKKFKFVMLLAVSQLASVGLADESGFTLIPSGQSSGRIERPILGSGTLVGNGVPSDHQASMDALLAELNISVATFSDISSWCGRVFPIFERELRRALNAAEMNLFDYANGILKNALQATRDSLSLPGNLTPPFTQGLVERTLAYAQMLELAMPESDLGRSRIQFLLLSKMMEYTKVLTQNWDVPLYIPFQNQYRNCAPNCPGQFDLPAYEQRMLVISAEQIDLLHAVLLEVVGNRAFPVGNAKGYLLTAEVMAAFIADDIERNLLAPRKSCAMVELRVIAQTLAAYNHLGDRTEYRKDISAVRDVYRRLTAIGQDLRSNQTNCN